MVRENSILLLDYGVMAVTRVFGTLSPSSNLGSPTKIGTKQLSVTLLNSVITLKLIIWVKKRKNVR